MQFRPQLFDFLALSAIVALLCRHNWRGSAPLWIAIPIIAIWSNLHGGFFIGLVAMGVYGAAISLTDIFARRGTRRGLGIIAITAAAAASTLCTFLIPPARDNWYTLIYSIRNPTTPGNIVDWKPLLASLTTAPAGSLEQKYFVARASLFRRRSRIGDSQAQRARTRRWSPSPRYCSRRRSRPSAISRSPRLRSCPVFANHLGLLLRPREVATHAPALLRLSPAGRWVGEILIAIVAIGFARYSGILKPGINASGNPADAVNFMNSHRLSGNVLR